VPTQFGRSYIGTRETLNFFDGKDGSVVVPIGECSRVGYSPREGFSKSIPALAKPPTTNHATGTCAV